jgi:ABC-type transport system involved in cytochrome c biogenesis permease subunit
MILVFAGTWAQIDQGIWQVQKQYFHSLWTWVAFSLFAPRTGHKPIPGGFPMPGGYLIGILLLINLLSAYLVKFRLKTRDWLLLPAIAASLGLAWLVPPSGENYYRYALFSILVLLPLVPLVVAFHGKRTGVILIHLGIVLLLVGEGVTSSLAHEAQMVLNDGVVTQFAQDVREAELAIVDSSPADHDNEVLISPKLLDRGGVIDSPSLPFTLRIDQYLPNSQEVGPMQAASAGANTGHPPVTTGQGGSVHVVSAPRATGTEAQTIDFPSVYVTAIGRDGVTLGTYLLSTVELFDINRQTFYELPPQTITAGGKDFALQLRFRRQYKPYTMQLLRFSHDKYTGTDVAKNFASQIHLLDPERKVDRNVRIKMNDPLRFAGETFYQASFKPGDHTSILQVVDNPGWLMPYVACTIGATGLATHFSLTLLGFLRKRKKTLAAQTGLHRQRLEWSSAAVLVPATILICCGMYVLSKTHIPPTPGDYDLDSFARLPISYEGRTLPMDSLARNSLKVMSGRDHIALDGKPTPSVQILLDLMARPEQATEHHIFRIDNQEVLTLLGLEDNTKKLPATGFAGQMKALFGLSSETKFYSMSDFRPHAKDLEREFTRAENIPAKSRDAVERAIVDLADHLNLYIKLSQHVGSLFIVPPAKAGEDWRPLDETLTSAKSMADVDPTAMRFVNILQAYHDQKPDDFNAEVAAYHAVLEHQVSTATTKAGFETWFNAFDPFMICIVLYIFIFILAAGSWIGWTQSLQRSALWLLGLVLIVHTTGLASRIYISGRPPVTNLASSAIFIAWAGVILATGLEFLYRNGIGATAAAVMGFTSLLISDRLSLTGDTMQVLQAVLDTNFWLATHVVCITLGYSATFLAGMLAVIYVLRGLFTTSLVPEDTKSSARMVYGIVCFAMLFSFVGTVLGGIWADQSWGRFWGWDPKENGAVLIVLWNAAILHARWGGITRDRGVMLMAIFGNVVTAWSWFGTNMLGVGLHSYGFMESAMFWLAAFVISQLAIIAAGNLPLRFWRSFGPYNKKAHGPRSVGFG